MMLFTYRSLTAKKKSSNSFRGISPMSKMTALNGLNASSRYEVNVDYLSVI